MASFADIQTVPLVLCNTALPHFHVCSHVTEYALEEADASVLLDEAEVALDVRGAFVFFLHGPSDEFVLVLLDPSFELLELAWSWVVEGEAPSFRHALLLELLSRRLIL